MNKSQKKNRQDANGFDVPSDAPETPAGNASAPEAAPGTAEDPSPVLAAGEGQAALVQEQAKDVQPEGAQVKPATPPADAPKAAPKEKEPAFPKCLKQSIAILQQIEAMPTRNPKEEKAKAERLAKIRKHVFDLQQGPPQPVMDANAITRQMSDNNNSIQQQRIEFRARSDRDFAFLLEENAKLRDAIAKLQPK